MPEIVQTATSKSDEQARRPFNYFWPIIGALLAFFGTESFLSLNNLWTETQADSAEAIVAIVLGIVIITAAIKAQR